MSNGKDLFLRKHGKVPRKDITFGTAERVYGYYRDHHNTTGTVPVPVPATQTGNAHVSPDQKTAIEHESSSRLDLSSRKKKL
jgi:hypothetical protein